ncbi:MULTISPECIES: hypothetical protein [Brachybacterium]|uniref:HTH cro/C1-type domain-containing protein n=1 Tax=Brachybacterium kimchii TaxID=2942909 RepID=A0ABY4N9X0_9MICO|nr:MULTISPECIES: hypothetical protein [Brachybacterium]MCG7308039.1 hypothetical protein [Brachybacterium sp. ACRRE]UQN30596.1 hypothetical protein M4486_04590 [Brachybacterium kimchii]
MSIAQLLEDLFARTAGPGGRPVTMQEIIRRMERGGIATMSLSYLQQLRKGEAKNPRLQHLRALADAFDVPPSYFTAEDSPSFEAASQLNPEEREIALRMHGLSDEALANVRGIVEMARRSERLDSPSAHRPDAD